MGTTPFMSVPYALDARRVEQRAFDELDVTESLTIGGGLTIKKIFEVTGITDPTSGTHWVTLPECINATDLWVLDASIYFYVFMGNAVYYGLGSETSPRPVGYLISESDDDPCAKVALLYGDLLRGKPFRITLMEVEGATVIH